MSKLDSSTPWMQATLLNTPTYVGLEDFLSHLMWLKSGNQNNPMNALSDLKDTPSDCATCAIVRTMSHTQLFLEPHGNYNPMFENSTLEALKVQFQLVSPDVHPEFKDDFKLGINHI